MYQHHEIPPSMSRGDEGEGVNTFFLLLKHERKTRTHLELECDSRAQVLFVVAKNCETEPSSDIEDRGLDLASSRAKSLKTFFNADSKTEEVKPSLLIRSAPCGLGENSSSLVKQLSLSPKPRVRELRLDHLDCWRLLESPRVISDRGISRLSLLAKRGKLQHIFKEKKDFE